VVLFDPPDALESSIPSEDVASGDVVPMPAPIIALCA
jgi:hypothetical protein